MNKLVEIDALRPQMAELLAAAVKARVTTIISGGTGSGKTTMLNALSAFISDKERLITIEDAAELQLQQPHVARMETRPPNIEGKGEIRQRELVKNALRMRPERIILGECRGEEAFDMLQAMNTGHEGSMATIHANNPREAISRLEQLIGMAGLPMTVGSIRGQISAAIRMIVQLQRLSDGKRRVTSIAEITGMEGDIVQMQEIYKFVRTGTAEDGTVQGHFQATGVRPRFLADLTAKGIKIPGSYFDPSQPLIAMFDIDPIYVFYGFAAISAILFVEGVYLLFFSASSYRSKINRRLALMTDQPDREGMLVQLRRERGLTSGGDYRLPIVSLNRLVLQSGLTIGFTKLILFIADRRRRGLRRHDVFHGRSALCGVRRLCSARRSRLICSCASSAAAGTRISARNSRMRSTSSCAACAPAIRCRSRSRWSRANCRTRWVRNSASPRMRSPTAPISKPRCAISISASARTTCRYS